MEKPRLKSYLTVLPLSEGRWALRGGLDELWHLELQDESAARVFGVVLPYLDGGSDRGEILRLCAEHGVEIAAAEQLLDTLASAGFLEDAGEESGGLPEEERERLQPQLSFLSRFSGHGGAFLQQRLHRYRVAVVGGGSLGHRLASDLREAGVGEVGERQPHRPSEANGDSPGPVVWTAEDGEPPDLFVLAQGAHDPSLLAAMDDFSLEHRKPWLLVRRLDPHEGWVGPLFLPGETATYRSLEARFRANHTHFETYRAFEEDLVARARPSVPVGGLAAFDQILTGMAVTEIVKLATGFAVPHLAGRFVTIDLRTWETELHQVLRLPRLDKLSLSRPRTYAWKEAPYGDQPTRRA